MSRFITKVVAGSILLPDIPELRDDLDESTFKARLGLESMQDTIEIYKEEWHGSVHVLSKLRELISWVSQFEKP